MTALSQFFLASAPSLYQYDLLEISHPNFSTTYRVVRNTQRMKLTALNVYGEHKRGIIVTHEGGAGPFEYEYVPMKVVPTGSSNDLAQSLSVVLGDLGDIIQVEIANIIAANGMNTRPTLKFRTYRSDDLTTPLSGPLVLEISNITAAEDGNSFDATAPRLNISRTGEIYDLDRFPMLRGVQ